MFYNSVGCEHYIVHLTFSSLFYQNLFEKCFTLPSWADNLIVVSFAIGLKEKKNSLIHVRGSLVSASF